MPLQVRELIIRTTIDDRDEPRSEQLDEKQIKKLKKEIIAEAVDKIKNELLKKAER